MQPDRTNWEGWARTLQRWGVHELAAAFLEAAGPISIFLAQVVYVGQPLLRSEQTQSLARMLEDPDESRNFANYLREERPA